MALSQIQQRQMQLNALARQRDEEKRKADAQRQVQSLSTTPQHFKRGDSNNLVFNPEAQERSLRLASARAGAEIQDRVGQLSQDIARKNAASTAPTRESVLAGGDIMPSRTLDRSGQTVSRLDGVPSPVREAPTVATAEAPLRSVGMGDDDFGALSDRDKQIQILMKQSKGEQLTDAERKWKISQFLDKQEVTPESMGFSAVGDEIKSQIAGMESEFEASKAAQASEREKMIAQKQQELDALAQQREDEARAAGRRERSAAQTALSFSGFGRSTFAAEKQAEVQRRV